MEDGTDEEDMDDVNLDDEKEHYWGMVFKDNVGGVDDKKALLNANRWDVYVNENEIFIKGGYLVEVVGNYGKKVLWEVVYNHVVEEATDNDEIGLWGFDFNLFDE